MSVNDEENYPWLIHDSIVHPEFRNRGIVVILINEMMTRLHKNAKPGAFVELMAVNGLKSYYKSFGFQTRAKDAPDIYFVIRD